MFCTILITWLDNRLVREIIDPPLISVLQMETWSPQRWYGEDRLCVYRRVSRRGWMKLRPLTSLNTPKWTEAGDGLSCAHGVDRWQDNCGGGVRMVSGTKMASPLRQALDWLRD